MPKKPVDKLCALGCVMGWGAFWAFGYLAISADPQAAAQMMTACALAFAGFLLGVFAYIRLGRVYAAPVRARARIITSV